MAVEQGRPWIERATAAIDQVMSGFEARMGYTAEEQIIRLADEQTVEIASALPDAALRLFLQVDEISWPDVWNGYFVGPTASVVSRHLGREHDRLAIGDSAVPVVVVGSDGGGGYFAIDAGGVVRVVTDPVVVGGVLAGSVAIVANGPEHFLDRLVDNALAAAREDAPPF